MKRLVLTAAVLAGGLTSAIADEVKDQIHAFCQTQPGSFATCVDDMTAKATSSAILAEAGGQVSDDVGRCKSANFISRAFGVNWRGFSECLTNRDLKRKGTTR